MNRKVKVAVVGTGEIAIKVRIPAYFSNRDVDLVALVDIDKKKAEKVAKKFGIRKCFESVDELFEKQDVDAVSICTPPHTHADLALKALEQDAHVLCEKPIANDVAKAKEMFDVSKAQQKILMISSYRRFLPRFRRVREHMLNGALGHVYCIEDLQLTPSPLLVWGKSPWFYHPDGGGVLFDFGPHCFDLMNYLYGDFPTAIMAYGSTYLDSPVEEFCVCTAEYPEKRVGVGTMSWLSSIALDTTSIHGTVETIYTSPKLFLELNRIDVSEVSLWREITRHLLGTKFPNLRLLHMPENVDPLLLETNHFIHQIKQDHISFENALNALNVLITIDAAKRALKENKKVPVASVKRI